MRMPAMLCGLALLASAGWAADAPKGVPTLALLAEWPEQKNERDVIHKTRIPRGGTFDVVAKVDLNGVEVQERERARVVATLTSPLAPAAALLDGVEQKDPAAPVALAAKAGAQEVRWRFRLPWTPPANGEPLAFEVAVRLPYQYADLKKSITLEQGVSCCDTTLAARLKRLAENRYCRMESIGKSTAGREMWLMRVTDFDAPAALKVQFVMVGAYHGNEPAGHESIPDFVEDLITKKENERYLKTCELVIIPCMNPDGREAGVHDHPSGVDMNKVYAKGNEIAEGRVVAEALRKCKGTYVRAIGMTTHQWGRPYLLLSHDCRERGDWSDRLMKNVGIRISNEMDEYVHVQSGPPGNEPYAAIRGFIFQELDMPSFVLEDVGWGYALPRLMKSIEREKRIYFAVLNQMLAPADVKPKTHPPQQIAFPPERNYEVFRVEKPPAIDGKLDEACWKHPSIVTGFVTGGRQSRQEGKTTVRAVYDDRNLYVAYECPDLKASDILPGKPGNLWAQDGADMFFDTNLNRWTYFQFQANANGAVSEGYWPIPGIHDSDTFRPKGIEVAGSVENGAIEIKIPFAAFNGHPEMLDAEVPSPPPAGTVWGVNFLRNLPSTSWAPMSGEAHAPWEFNAMTFTGKTR